MSRPVLLILMLLAGWLWLSRLGTRSSGASGQGQGASREQGTGKPAAESQASQPIEQCAVCGVHAPRTGMIALAGGRYRCPEHADRGSA
ncbi:hypothetical protein [Ralstonia pickettii]|uniref:hypothetical protein n=1 Tax=Ralstonia pickettii TaxID=329 RepID=UPI000818C7E1|nr:hypothetical protein [Ralstonia pickettii]OCS48095.1 hypothetical protein BEK67_14520 [Ralstonia pickettii]